MPDTISRRRFFLTAAAASAATLTGCRPGTTAILPADGRITARPGVVPNSPMSAGIHDLVVANSDRHCWLIVPEGYDPAQAWPLTLFFRGAITPARVYVDAFKAAADELGLVILAPEATSRTWDMILAGFGPDVEFINLALQTVYRSVHIDQSRIATSGFSDGASYSLSLGLTNGDIFSKIAAYSPGFMQIVTARGQPGFFITHGTMDEVLPVDSSRYITAQLEAAGYEVDYREFNGTHGVSLSLARASFEWMVGTSTAARR